MRLDKPNVTTILVGPNNSGKTSAIEAMLTFLQRPIKHLSINDFLWGVMLRFKKFEQRLDAACGVRTQGDDAAVAAPPPVAALPTFADRIVAPPGSTTTDRPRSRAIAGELLMDLEDASRLGHGQKSASPCEDPDGSFARAYLKDRDDDQSFVELSCGHPA